MCKTGRHIPKKISAVILAKGGPTKYWLMWGWILMHPKDDCFVVLIIICVTIKWLLHLETTAFYADQIVKKLFKSVWIPVGKTTVMVVYPLMHGLSQL